uniref:EF-hand domain-containing protein n=1 Tax=Macrostomum lignano TaxID=282301 RepID=A0A1I8INX5_9PLAT
TDADADADADVDAKANEDVKTDADADADAKTDVDADADAKTDADADADVDADADADAVADAGAKADADVDVDAKANKDAKADKNVDANAEAEVNAGPDVNAEENADAEVNDRSQSLPPAIERQLKEAGVPADQRRMYFQAYTRVERGRGHVTRDDMYTALQLLGQCPQSQEEVLQQLSQHGEPADGRLSLTEFASFCAAVCRSREAVRAELEASFRVFDTDGSGYLDRQELRRA